MNTRTQRLALALPLALGLLVLGAVAGGVLSKFGDQHGMGWDQLARGLGWMMGGGLAGVGLAILLARRASVVTLRITTLVTVLVAGTLVIAAVMEVRREQERAAAEASRARPTAPTAVPVP